MLIGLGSGKYASRKFDYILSTSNPLFLFSYLSFSFPESFVIGLNMNGSGPSQMATSFRPQQPDNNHSPCFWTESCSKLRRERVLLQKAHSSFERGAKKTDEAGVRYIGVEISFLGKSWLRWKVGI